jgi:hypothetical protein
VTHSLTALILALGIGANVKAQHSNDKRGEKSLAAPPSNTSADTSAKQEFSVPLTTENIISATLSLWTLTNGGIPNANLLKGMQASPDKMRLFRQELRSSEKIGKSARESLASPYAPELLDSKTEAREKFINFVSKFQNRFPQFQNVMPEVLTAWGESRGLMGLSAEHDELSQAKIASVIQVLRNRSSKKLEGQNLGKDAAQISAKTKWETATQRYQFSAYEPYDPNLKAITLGPKRLHSRIFSLESLGPYERRALQNIAAVIFKMNKGEIVVPNPLGDLRTVHYLTPELMPFSKGAEHRELKKVRLDPRLNLLRIPAERPRYLALVPNWATQNGLLREPRVRMQLQKSFRDVLIPEKYYLYFWSVP